MRRQQRRQNEITESLSGRIGISIWTQPQNVREISRRSLIRDDDVDGIVVTGLGLGGVPGAVFDAIQEARAKGIPVVMGTRVQTGRVFPLSATKGSALSLKAIGCCANLSPQKGRILLMLA